MLEGLGNIIQNEEEHNENLRKTAATPSTCFLAGVRVYPKTSRTTVATGTPIPFSEDIHCNSEGLLDTNSQTVDISVAFFAFNEANWLER